jgi:hypothetical protein
VFQKVSLEMGRKVAFLGLDGNDNDDEARSFLKRFPVSYPSYSDPDVRLASSIKAGLAFPMTVFINPKGEVVYSHPGPYEKAADLVSDIRRYTR